MDPLAAASAGPSPDQVRRATEEVLGGPEFKPASTTVDGLMDMIRRASASLAAWADRHPVAAWGLIVLLVLVLIAILLHLAWTFYRVVLHAGPARANGGRARAPTWEILEGAASDWPTALAKASQALRSGDQRRAVWIGHRVLLGLLDEGGALQFASWKTNADYVAECPSTPAPLAEMTQVYDEVVYGHRRVDPNEIGRLLERVGRSGTEQAR